MQKKKGYALHLPILEKALQEVFGVDDAEQHIEKIREFDNIDDGMNYIQGALVASYISFSTFLDALESNGEKE